MPELVTQELGAYVTNAYPGADRRQLGSKEPLDQPILHSSASPQGPTGEEHGRRAFKGNVFK